MAFYTGVTCKGTNVLSLYIGKTKQNFACSQQLLHPLCFNQDS